MIATPFFDESDSNTVVRVRPRTYQTSTEYSSKNVSSTAPCSAFPGETSILFHYDASLQFSGTVTMPSLNAVLFWWLEAGSRDHLHLLAVNDDKCTLEAQKSQSRMLSIELPLSVTKRSATPSSDDLLICGVTKLPGDANCVAVSWMFTSLEVGYLRVMVLRDGDTRGVLSLIPDGAIVEGICLKSIKDAFNREERSNHNRFAVSNLLPSIHLKGQTRNILSSFMQRGNEYTNSTATPQLPRETREDQESPQTNEADFIHLHACIVSEIPEGQYGVVTVFVVTNGTSVWRAQLHLDGTAQFCRFKENSTREETVAWFSETDWASMVATSHSNVICPSYQKPIKSDHKGWLGRLFHSSENNKTYGSAMVSLEYAAVTAIQNSPYVGLLRWNGMFELYNFDLEPLRNYPICPLPHMEIMPTVDANATFSSQRSCARAKVQQWASQMGDSSSIHVCTFFELPKGSHVIWSRVPQMLPSLKDRFVTRCCYSLAPPVPRACPTGCAVNAAERLAVTWDLGLEEDGDFTCMRSISSVLYPARGVSAVLQLIEAYPGPQQEWQWSSTHAFLCLGDRLESLVCHGVHFVLLERRQDYYRAYVAQFASRWLQHLIEVKQLNSFSNPPDGIEISYEDHMVDSTDRHFSPTTLCLVSTSGLDSRTSAALYGLSACTAFWEGWDVLELAPGGADKLAAILRESIKLPLTGHLPSLDRLRSHATLAGYVSSVTVTEELVQLAIREAMRTKFQLSLPGIVSDRILESALMSPGLSFFSYSRRYILHAVLRELFNRIAFLSVTFVGWVGSDAWSLDSFVSSQLTRAIAFLSAAYYTVCVAGSDLARLANTSEVEDSDGIVDQILQVFLYPAPDLSVTDATDLRVATRLAVEAAARLQRGGSVRLFKASVEWAAQLRHWYPILQHYALSHDLHSGRIVHSAQQLALCQAVSHSLSRLEDADELAWVLLDLDFLGSDEAGSSSWNAMLSSSSQQRKMLKHWIQSEPSLAVKLYAVGVLRRLIPTDSLVMRASTELVQRYYLVELLLVLQRVLACPPQQEHKTSLGIDSAARVASSEACSEGVAKAADGGDSMVGFRLLTLPGSADASSFQYALQELHVEALLCLSYAALNDFDFGSIFHNLEDAFELAEKLGISNRYAESFNTILDGILECAYSDDQHMEALLTISNTVLRLDEILMGKWYNCIARMVTRAFAEALCQRAIMGLYRYLMHRHAYGQCGRVMSDVASLVRSSSLHRSAAFSISVGELASMALHAVELIAPVSFDEKLSSTLGEHGSVEEEVSEDDREKNAILMSCPVRAQIAWRSTHVFGIEAASYGRRSLSRADLSWLRRRVYQAHCERKLWERGSTLDCADLWIDGTPQVDFELAVKRLTNTLMESRLWPEAYRFAMLSEGDPCNVLENWVAHLVRQADPDAKTSEDELFQWLQIIDCCAEQSTLDNQFMGYHRVLKVALSLSYAKTLPALREAHRCADPYSAMATLLEVFYIYQQRLNKDGGRDDIDDTSSEGSTFQKAVAWLPWVDAARIAIELLQASPQTNASPQHDISNDKEHELTAESNNKHNIAILTAGILDRLVRHGKELLRQPAVMKQLDLYKVDKVVRGLLSSFS